MDFIYKGPTHCLHYYDYSGCIRIGDKFIDFEKGDITCISADTNYSFHSDNPKSHLVIHFFPHTEMDENEQLRLDSHYTLKQYSSSLREQFITIGHLWREAGVFTAHKDKIELEAEYRLMALMMNVYRLKIISKDNVQVQSRLSKDKLWDLIDTNLAEDLSSAWLAERLNLPPATLAKDFKMIYGCSIHAMILQKRIARSKILLSNTNKTVYEIGAIIGIADPQYFNKQFRKIVNMSPRTYRNIQKSSQNELVNALSTKDGSWK
jgi:AraC-like DNA-binding protein